MWPQTSSDLYEPKLIFRFHSNFAVDQYIGAYFASALYNCNCHICGAVTIGVHASFYGAFIYSKDTVFKSAFVHINFANVFIWQPCNISKMFWIKSAFIEFRSKTVSI